MPPHATAKRAHAATAHSQTQTATGHSAQAQPTASQARGLSARLRGRRRPALPAKLTQTEPTAGPHPRERATQADLSLALPAFRGAAHATSRLAPPARRARRGRLQQRRRASVTTPTTTMALPRARCAFRRHLRNRALSCQASPRAFSRLPKPPPSTQPKTSTTPPRSNSWRRLLASEPRGLRLCTEASAPPHLAQPTLSRTATPAQCVTPA